MVGNFASFNYLVRYTHAKLATVKSDDFTDKQHFFVQDIIRSIQNLITCGSGPTVTPLASMSHDDNVPKIYATGPTSVERQAKNNQYNKWSVLNRGGSKSPLTAHL
ncbi:hypothetical protein J6590_069564 [Homalodisca vitripennis]|nr:hypothetical protein J6590_069564 [Homalodisca vitripennis]